MHPLFKNTHALLASAALGVAALSSAPAMAQQSPDTVLFAKLKGASHSGKITVTVDTEAARMCYMLNVAGLSGVTAAHIKRGADVVDLEAPVDGASGACVPLDAAMAQALVDNPEAYEVSVATATFPDGAIKGSLMG